MDIETIKKDAKDLEAILNKIRDNMNDIPNGFSHDNYMEIYREKNGDLIKRYKDIEKKYIDIFGEIDVPYDPPYESSSIGEYLKFFVTLYDKTNKEGN